jgi:hypothetical protein
MSLRDENTNDLAGEVIRQLARSGLPPIFAKLYSQHTRLGANQPGLGGWFRGESFSRLEDALRLLEAAFIRRDAGESDWTDGVRRCGELLEWLSHPQLNPGELPLSFLAAAAYQIAGYPARASGLLNQETTGTKESEIIRWLLKADFRSLLEAISQEWGRTYSQGYLNSNSTSIGFSADGINQRIIDETIRSLGILCAEVRWGDDPRIEKALDRLTTIGKIILHTESAYSWLLAKMCAEVASLYVKTSMRRQLKEFASGLNTSGQDAIERYLRLNYLTGKALAWPSQIKGFQKLVGKDSFAFCTNRVRENNHSRTRNFTEYFFKPTRRSGGGG